MKKLIAIVLGLVIVIVICLTSCSSKPELVVSNAYKHKGDYNGNFTDNAYTFEIKNKSRIKSIESVDYFTIYFFDEQGNNIGSWDAGRIELEYLALNANRSYKIQINVPESDLPYSEEWSYDIAYSLNYYD